MGHERSNSAEELAAVAIQSYRDLDVWQRGVDVAVRIYALARRFPKDEVYGMTSQTRRSAVSIPSNIAEGHARSGAREFAQFVAVSLGSLAELETQIEIAVRVGYLKRDESDVLAALESMSHLRAQLLNLRAALLRRIQARAREKA